MCRMSQPEVLCQGLGYKSLRLQRLALILILAQVALLSRSVETRLMVSPIFVL